MRPVHFKWKDTARGQAEQIGFIAQEVEKVLPQIVENPETDVLVTAADGTKTTIDDALSMSYATMVTPLVKAVQQLKQENDQLRTQLETADDNYEALRRDVQALKDAH